MKIWKYTICLLFLAAVLWMGREGVQVQAAGGEGYDLIGAVRKQPEKPGKWVKNKNGYRYRYAGTKKYAKNTWLLADGSIYFTDKNGYRVTGWKKYKKSRYYLDEEDGRLTVGWKVADGEKYYFSKNTGAMLAGWQKIGKKQYYFSEEGKLQKNMWIGDRYVGAKGCEQAAKRIFVGDSRTIELRDKADGGETYIAKWGKGYDWFMESGKRQLEKQLKKYPYSAVILNLGVNDLANAQAYIRVYQELRAAYPKARFYFMSVNPVEETFLRANGYGGRDNASIEAFNEQMQSVFGSRYIDTYHWMLEREYVMDLPGGHGTVDGLHYIDIVYQMLHAYVTARAR